MMNDQCFLVLSLACLALGSMVWEFGQQRRVSWMAASVGVFSIVGLSYIAINPVEERHGVARNPVPITNSVVGIQNISVEDPLLGRLRESAVIVAAAYRNSGPPPNTKAMASNRDSSGNIVPAYWRIK